MASEKKENIVKLITYKHNLLTRVVCCLLVLVFSMVNIAYGYEKKNVLRQLRYIETLKGQGANAPSAGTTHHASRPLKLKLNISPDTARMLGPENMRRIWDLLHGKRQADRVYGRRSYIRLSGSQKKPDLEGKALVFKGYTPIL